MDERAKRRLIALLEPAIEAMGYELVDLEGNLGGRHRLLRLYIDRPAGSEGVSAGAVGGAGITLDDCEAVSHQVSGILDVEDPIPGEYQLEVSSPGLDRKLTKPTHFDRFQGHRVHARLKQDIDGRRRLTGTLVGRDGDRIRLRLDDSELAIAFEDLELVRLVPEL